MHRISLPVLLIALLSCTSAEARTWRPKNQAPVTGEFAGVNGDKVQIQTRGGITEISYLSLNRADRALVKSSLQIQGRSEEAKRLVGLESSGSTPASPAAPPTNGQPAAEGTPTSTSGTGPRTWRDINGRELQAEFISTNGQTVTLRVNGNVQSFPLIGFSAADQDWLATQQGTEGSGAAEGGISFFGAAPPGMPSSGSGSSGMSQPGFNFPGFPGSMPNPGVGMPPVTGMPPGMSMPPGAGMMPPAMSGPPGGQFPATSVPPQFPDSSMPAGGGRSSFPQEQPQFPQTQFPAPSFPEPSFPEPNFPQVTPPELPPTDFAVPQFEFVMKCDQCGSEFTEADGVKVGDSCPKCSSGGGFRMGSTRGLFKGIGFLIAVVVGAVGWVIKKMNGSE